MKPRYSRSRLVALMVFSLVVSGCTPKYFPDPASLPQEYQPPVNALISTVPRKALVGALPVVDMQARGAGKEPISATWQYIDGADAFNARLDERLLGILDAHAGGRHEPAARTATGNQGGSSGTSVTHEVILATGSTVGVRFVQETVAGGVRVGYTEEITYEDLGTGTVTPSASLIDAGRIGRLRDILRGVAFPSARIAGRASTSVSAQPDVAVAAPPPVQGPASDAELLSAVAFNDAGDVRLILARNPESGVALKPSVAVDLSTAVTQSVLSPSGHTIRQSILTGSAFTAPSPSPPETEHINCDLVACLALTYDDGPNDQTTRLLKILEKHKVRATFFQQGAYVQSNPEIAAAVAEAGHAIGNHTMSHPYLTKLPADGIHREVRENQTAIEQAAGVTPDFMRPPYGATDAHVASQVALPQIIWDVDSLDWQSRNKADFIPRVMSLAKPGSIILQHDVHASTVDGQEELIEQLKSAGYFFVTLQQLFAGIQLQPGETYKCRGPSAGCTPGR